MILKSCGTLDRDTLLAKVHAHLTALGDDVRQCGGQSAEPMRIPIDKFQILKVCQEVESSGSFASRSRPLPIETI
jgi:hypothetical protein